jgi:hypothetical protein
MTPFKELPVLVTPASRPTFEPLLIAQACHQDLRPLSRDPHILPYLAGGCWSALEKKWNGVILNCLKVILQCALRMT